MILALDFPISQVVNVMSWCYGPMTSEWWLGHSPQSLSTVQAYNNGLVKLGSSSSAYIEPIAVLIGFLVPPNKPGPYFESHPELFYLYHVEQVIKLRWKHLAGTAYNLDTNQLRHGLLLEVVAPIVMIVLTVGVWTRYGVVGIRSVVMWVLITWWLYNGRTRTCDDSQRHSRSQRPYGAPSALIVIDPSLSLLSERIRCLRLLDNFWLVIIIGTHTASPFVPLIIYNFSDTPYNFDHTSQGLIKTGERSIYPPFLTRT